MLPPLPRLGLSRWGLRRRCRSDLRPSRSRQSSLALCWAAMPGFTALRAYHFSALSEPKTRHTSEPCVAVCRFSLEWGTITDSYSHLTMVTSRGFPTHVGAEGCFLCLSHPKLPAQGLANRWPGRTQNKYKRAQ